MRNPVVRRVLMRNPVVRKVLMRNPVEEEGEQARDITWACQGQGRGTSHEHARGRGHHMSMPGARDIT